MHYRTRLPALLCLMVGVALLCAGCESSGSQLSYGTGYLPTEPTTVIVRPFAVSVQEAGRDGDVLPAWILSNPRPQFQTDDDLRYGALAAEAVARELINELRVRGIKAVMDDGTKPLQGAAVITGQFANLDSGTKWLRPEVGYTLSTRYEARVQVTQHNNLAFEMAVYSNDKDDEGARDLAAQVAHQIYGSYVLGGWGGAGGK